MSELHPLRCHPPSSPITTVPIINTNPPILEDDVPDDDDFVTPPRFLTHSPTLHGSESEFGGDTEELDSVHEEPLCFTMSELEDKRRLINVFCTQGDVLGMFDLSVSALERVFDHLPAKADQCALTFVDKSTASLLMHKLYHTVIVDLSTYPRNLEATTNLFRTHPACRLVKHVIFDDSSIVDKGRPPPGFDYLAALVIEHVPLYQLERFDWPADFELSPVLTHRLMDRQDNLKNLALYNATLSAGRKEANAAIKAMDQLEALRVSPSKKYDLRNIHHAIKQRALKELHVDLRTYHPPENELDFWNSEIQDFGVFASLFEHVPSLRDVPLKYQFSLTKLTLWKVNLWPSKITWQQVLRPNTLKELEIWMCPFGSRFLNVVAGPQLSLTKLSFTQKDDGQGGPKTPPSSKDSAYTVKAVANALRALAGHTEHKSNVTKPCGLKYLHLSINETKDDYADWDNDALSLHTPHLEVLSLDLPSSCTTDAARVNHLYDALGNCCPTGLQQLLLHHSTWETYNLDLTKLNPVTIVLLSSHPGNGHVLANDALCRLRAVHGDNTRLRVVATSRDGDGCFVRCEAVVMGRRQEMMVPVSLAELRRSEKEIDVLLPPPTEFGKYGRGASK